MALVNEAYRVLSDPGRRAIYDRALLGGGGSGSAAGSGTGSAAGSGSAPWSSTGARPTGSGSPADVWRTARSGRTNYGSELQRAKVPWRLGLVMAVIGVTVVIAGAALFDGPVERAPDGVITSGSCVEILPNSDAREIRCTGEDDLVVDRLVPRDERCPGGTTAHRDTLGRGLACVLPPTSGP